MQDGDVQNGAAARRSGGGGDRDVDMEVSFLPGLDLGQELYEKRRNKQSRLAETVWQAYERRRKCASNSSVSSWEECMQLHVIKINLNSLCVMHLP